MDQYIGLVDRFKGKRILILGDFILDEYLYGETERISREAPVLILRYSKSVYVAGGGANPVMNIKDLGAEPVPVSIAGTDNYSQILIKMMEDKGVDVSHIVRTDNYSVPVKARVMAGSVHTAKQQIVRIDRYYEGVIPKEIEVSIINHIKALLPSVSAVLVSDYGGGIITDKVIKYINSVAKSGVKVIVDSRYALGKYRNIATATPNETEAGPAVGIESYSDRDTERTAKLLTAAMKAKGMIVTRGSRGMIIFEKGKLVSIPAYGSEEIVDVSGAGDTVSSVVALALGCGASLVDAAKVANVAGGVVVMKRGTATISARELKGELKNAGKN
jgi:rfaE bifunctional protein kinase chain/domain